ncbi:hypothetical protein GCM10020366_11390 [Saccharopolyspora gregorii]
MATFAPRGRIRTEEVAAETQRLLHGWQRPNSDHSPHPSLDHYLTAEEIAEIDPFDRPQLAFTIHTCKQSSNLSEAGRKLFAVSREKRKSTNDGDRLRKYLAKFHLHFDSL